jgi:hypothetical protein
MIYDVNFFQTAQELSPSFRRTKEEFEGLNAAFAEPMNDLNLIFKWYREGSTAPDYSNVTVYNFGDVVKYAKVIYLRNEITDGYSAGIEPTNFTFFTKIIDLFIGVDERVKYQSQKIVFEYALNRFFETTFRQPPLVSDIYITRDFSDLTDFWIAETDIATATVGETDTDTTYVDEDETTRSAYDYVIKFPLAAYNALASTNPTREKIVRVFADKINAAGFKYIIQTY